MFTGLVKFINVIIKAFGKTLVHIINLLPDSPFEVMYNSVPSNLLSHLAWIIPFKIILSVAQAWVSAIMVYYSCMLVLRWIKAIE